MRVLVDGRFIQDHYPGIGRSTYNLLRALPVAGAGHEYCLVFNPGQSDSRDRLAELASVGVELVECRAGPASPASQIELPRLARRLGVALFHAPHYLKPPLMPCPVVTTIHDVNPARYPASLPSRRARLLFGPAVRLAIATSARVITVSDYSRRELIRRLGAAPVRVVVAYNAADPAYRPGLAGTPAAAAVRDRYHLPPAYLLYVGINKPLKNLERLIAAYAGLVADPDLGVVVPPLVLAGYEDPRYPGPRRLAGELGLADRVRFLGDVAEADLPYVYARATAFVFPSLAEGFGLPPLEALACGVPVAASRSSSLPEVCGDAALYFDPFDTADIARALARLLQNADLRRDLTAAGPLQAARFSWQQTAATVVATYEAAVRQ